MRESILKSLFEQYDVTRLDEFTVKDISKIINPNDLPHRDYEPLLKQVQFQGVKKNIAKFLVMNNHNGWETYIGWDNWDEQIRDINYSAMDIAKLLMWSGNIKIYCKCPAFTFWGMKYICTQLGCSLVPENRFPHKRNPHLKGISCKHLSKTLRVLPFHTNNLAAAINQQRNKLGISYKKN